MAELGGISALVGQLDIWVGCGMVERGPLQHLIKFIQELPRKFWKTAFRVLRLVARFCGWAVRFLAVCWLWVLDCELGSEMCRRF